MFKSIRMWFAVLAAGAASAFGTAQHYAGKVDAAKEQWRTEHLAGFVETCPYIKTNYPDYRRAWDRTYPYDAAVWWFARNQAQYFPELTEELAKQCFSKPVKAAE